MGNKGGMLLLLCLTFATGEIRVAAGQSATGKETVVQGKPLAYWLKELKDADPLVQEEALAVIASAGEAAQGAAPVLVELLKDKSPPIRVKAAIVLGKLKGQAKHTAPVLLDAWKDGSLSLRHEILPAFGPLALDHEEILVLLLRASSDANLKTRFLASLGINKLRPGVFAPLARALNHDDPVVRRQAILHLGSAGKEYVPALNRMLKDEDWNIRFEAAYALVRIEKNPRAHFAIIIEASTKDDPQTRKAALDILLDMKPPAKEALAVYQAGLKEGSLTRKLQAAEAVWHITRKADDVLPTYREVLGSTPSPSLAMVQPVLHAVQPLGSDAKALRVPLLGLLQKGTDVSLLRALPPVLTMMGSDSIPILEQLIGSLTDKGAPVEHERSRAASHTLGLLGKDGLKPLIKLTEHQVYVVRTLAYQGLQQAGSDAKDALPALRKVLKHENARDRAGAVRVLAGLGPDAKEALADLLEVVRKDKDATNRRYALAALPHLQPTIEDIRGLLNDALEDRDPLMRLTAADWLWHLDFNDPRPVKVVANVLKDPRCSDRALKMLVHHRDKAGPAIPALTELLSHPNAHFRTLAIRTFEQMGIPSKEIQQKLVAALGDPDQTVRLSAAAALRRLGVEENAAVDSLVKSLEKMPANQRVSAVLALAEFGSAAKDAIPVIERLMPAPIGISRVVWIETLAAIDPVMVPKWKASLEEAFDKYRSLPAARLLGQHFPNETKYVDFLVEKLQDSNAGLRGPAAMILVKGGPWARQAVPALRQALDDSNPRVRIQAALALEKLEPGRHKIVPVLVEVLRDKVDYNLRLQAAIALADLGPAALDAVPALRVAVRDPEPIVRFTANEALWKIDPKSAMPCILEGY